MGASLLTIKRAQEISQTGDSVDSVLKALVPITFSSPRAQPEVVYFLISNESPYFSDCKSKISAPNSLQFWRYTKNGEINWYTRK